MFATQMLEDIQRSSQYHKGCACVVKRVVRNRCNSTSSRSELLSDSDLTVSEIQFPDGEC